MSGIIYLLHDNDRLDPVRERACESESLLQELLARHPALLAGDQMDEAAPRRWLLVKREMGVPDEPEAGNRWAVDHLFLDQDGVPTLVEVKRAADTRIRREVVGQLLDYAANAVLHWPADDIQTRFEAACEVRGDDPAETVAEFLGGADPDVFWQSVKTNLQAGRVRLVFVADEVPRELARVVEFLNAQMDPAEVLAVEVRQYVGVGSVRTLVPRVIGRTAAAGRRKGGRSDERVAVGEADFLAAARATLPDDEYAVVIALIEWARGRGLGANYKRGKTDTSFLPAVRLRTRTSFPFSFTASDGAWLQLKNMRNYPPVSDPVFRAELHRRLELTGVTIAPERMIGFPKLEYAALVPPAALAAALEAFDWLVDELQKALT
jgi:hypothetical protein